MTTALIDHVRKAALSVLTDVSDAYEIADRTQNSITAELGTFQLIPYVEPVELEGELIDADGIDEGISREQLLRAISDAMTGEDSYRYRGWDISVAVGHELVVVTLDQWLKRATLSANSMSLAGALALMRDLDQLIDYLRAERA